MLITLSIAKKHTENFFFEGYLFGIPGKDVEKTIRSLYAKHGLEFTKFLNGVFFCCFYDETKGHAILINDRLGLKDMFIHQNVKQILISSSFHEITSRIHNLTPDIVGIHEYIKFCYPLYEKTFFQEIKLMPPGTLLVIDNEKLEILRQIQYKPFNLTPDYGRSYGSRKEELWNLYLKAIRESFIDLDKSYAIPNSGGLDSRTLLFLAQYERYDFISYTYGQAPSEAYYIASRLTKAMNLDQRYIPIEIDFLTRYGDMHFNYCSDLPIHSSWYFSAYNSLKDIDINLPGFDANYLDTFIHMDPKHSYNDYFEKGLDGVYEYNYQLHSLLDIESMKQLVKDDLSVDIWEHFKDGMKDWDKKDFFGVSDRFEIENRQRKLTGKEPWLDFYGMMESRCPLLHGDLVDFSLNIPFELRVSRKIELDTLKDRMGKISKIRFERQSFNMHHTDSQWNRLRTYFFKFDRDYLSKLGFSLVFRGRHKNVQGWMLLPANLDYIKRILDRPSERFDAIFNRSYITENLNRLIENNYLVVSNLVSLKMNLDELDTS